VDRCCSSADLPDARGGRGAARRPRLHAELHDPELAVVRGAAIFGEKLELERMVTADLVTRVAGPGRRWTTPAGPR